MSFAPLGQLSYTNLDGLLGRPHMQKFFCSYALISDPLLEQPESYNFPTNANVLFPRL